MAVQPVVLVVEADAFTRDIFQRVLERTGFSVRTASHGKEALTSFREGGIGLVLTDLLMPELDGFQLIQALKWRAPNLPVIAISVMNDVESCRDTAVKLGAERAVCKPILLAHWSSWSKRSQHHHDCIKARATFGRYTLASN